MTSCATCFVPWVGKESTFACNLLRVSGQYKVAWLSRAERHNLVSEPRTQRSGVSRLRALPLTPLADSLRARLRP